MWHKQNETTLIQLILLLFTAVGVTYALVTPAFEASDELWHYPMIEHLADGNPLPVQVYDPAQAGPWKQEASQPPLYYYVGAALTFWVDTADMETTRRLNPHVDNGVVTADGNVNLAIHDPDLSGWSGTLLAIRIVRLFSVLLGTATVYLTYLIGKEVTPHRSDIPLGAAVLAGFTPMFLFISGAVNNDNLAVPLASLGLLLLIRLVRRTSPDDGWAWPQIALIGAVIGAAVLTKQGTIGLIPLSLGAFFIYEWRRDGRVETLAARPFWIRVGRTLLRTGRDLLVLAVPIVLIAGWWYARNLRLYGDLLGWSAFIAVLGERETAAPLAQLWDERWGFMLSYWGLFGGVNVPMWDWTYYVLNGLLVAAGLGGLVVAARHLRDFQVGRNGRVTTQTIVANLFSWVTARFGLVVCVLFGTAVIYGLIQWATTTWSSQGRLVFTAMSALNVLFALGLAGWLPERLGRWVLAVVGGGLIALAAVAPWAFIAPTYRPSVTNAARPCAQAVCLSADAAVFGDGVRLVGYTLDPVRVQPGRPVDVTLEWAITGAAATQRDWSVFVHLNDPVLGVPIAQRDMYLAQGLRPTSLLDVGDRIINRYRLQVPPTAVAPTDLGLAVGLYDFYTGQRLALSGGGDVAQLDTVSVQPIPGETPNATAVNFADRLRLVGYEVTPRRTTAGRSITLTTYWRATTPLDTDYTFFAQVLDADTTRWAAADMGQPTSRWAVGETQAVEMPLQLDPDTPPNVYPLRVGVYSFTDESGFQNLQTVTADGRLTDPFINLTRIRID